MSTDRRYTEFRTAKDITPEVEKIVEDYAQGWPEASVMDIIDRIERGTSLENGTYADFGSQSSSPAITRVRKIVREARAG